MHFRANRSPIRRINVARNKGLRWNANHLLVPATMFESGPTQLEDPRLNEIIFALNAVLDVRDVLFTEVQTEIPISVGLRRQVDIKA